KSIRNRAALGRWLYRVAANVARRMRRQFAVSGPMPADIPGMSPTTDGDYRDLLIEEVARLPEKYRLPVQLCYWAGLTPAGAARRLDWPKGTVLTRLAGARERLRKRLTQRGVSPAVLVGLVGATVTIPAARAGWLPATSRAAKEILAG